MRRLHRRIESIGLALCLAAVAACGEDGGPSGTIAISTTTTTLTIPQGASEAFSASVSRSGGFTGTVTITTEGMPTGVTTAVSAVSTTGTTTTGTITVTVAAAVPLGAYPITVRATGDGVTAATQVVTLTVTAVPAIAITVAPSPITVNQGSSGGTTVTIARTNFTGNVTLALEGAPAGVTATFTPSPATGTTAAVNVQVAASVAAGNYPLTIRATGTGVVDATVPLQLTVAAAADYSISLVGTNPLSVLQGASGTLSIELARTNFTGAVTLSLEGAPTGVTATFDPAAPTGNASTLTIPVGATTVPGDYLLTVRGVAQGLTDRTTTFTLTVTVAGSFGLTTTPPGAITVAQSGAAVDVTVNIGRTGGFTGAVGLAVTGAPAGLSAVLAPTSTTGNTSTLTVTAGAGAPIGAHLLTITGTAAGLANQAVTLTANVTAPAGGNVTLNYAGCSADDKPTWLAFQDGSAGTWTRITPTGDSYSLNSTAGTAGLAVVLAPTGGGSGVLIQYYSQAELTNLATGSICPTPPATKTITATTVNLGALQTALISIGGGTGSANVALPTASISGVASGTFDLIGYARDIAQVGGSDRLFLRRDVNTTPIPANGSVGANLDFTGSESTTPAAATITLGNTAGGEQVIHGMFYQTGASCQQAVLYSAANAGVNTSFTAYGVPAGLQRATDYHGVSVTSAGGTTTFRTVIEYFQTLAARTVTLPSLLPTFTPTALAGPYKRLQFAFTLPTGVASSTTLVYSDNAAKSVLISATAGYLGGTTVNLAMPDLSAVAGWNNTWAPASAATVDWSASGSGTTLANACAGGSFVSSTRQGTL
jgi:hypothetical protein